MARIVSRPIEAVTKGMSIVDPDGRRFKISNVTSRIAVVVNTEDRFVESVIHSFIRAKYREILE